MSDFLFDDCVIYQQAQPSNASARFVYDLWESMFTFKGQAAKAAVTDDFSEQCTTCWVGAAGTAAAGDTFSVPLLADADETGVLVALGLNEFFSGADAADIAVTDSVSEDPMRIAASGNRPDSASSMAAGSTSSTLGTSRLTSPT